MNLVNVNHTINISVQGGFYIKLNDQWFAGSKIYMKDAGDWREIDSSQIPNLVQNKILRFNT